MIGFTLLTLIPGIAFVVLVVLGRMQAPTLIAAFVLIGFALLRIYAIRAN